VPLSSSPTHYTALFTLESPDVRFDDVLLATLTEPTALVPIDPRYLEVCDRGSVTVCGCVPDSPVLVGAAVVGPNVRITLGGHLPRDLALGVTIRLTGIRKGFAGKRFPNRTREQFVANERFLRRAYPGAGQ